MKEYAYQTKAMGSDVSISFICANEKNAIQAKEYAFNSIAQYELCFSRFLPDSELSQLNTNGAITASDTFCEVYIQAITLSRETNYVFNPLVQITSLGYTDTYDSLPAETDLPQTPTYNTDIESLQYNTSTNTISLQPGQQLDFGGLLKGFLSEKIAKQIESDYPEFQGIIINLGGDLHTRGLDVDSKIFEFSIYNPITHQEHPIPLHNQSLATSGTYKRTWKANGIRQHHILDASGTKNPETTTLSASVIGSSGARCEAYTKVLINTPVHLIASNLQKKGLCYLTINKQGVSTTNI